MDPNKNKVITPLVDRHKGADDAPDEATRPVEPETQRSTDEQGDAVRLPDRGGEID